MKPFTMLAIVIFLLVAIVHLCRLSRPFEVVVHGAVVPQWASIVGFIVSAVLALMLSGARSRR